MPKKLNTEEVKAIFEKYGYTVPNDFVYKNNITHYRVYDEQEGKHKDMTYKMLQYQIKKGRSEMLRENEIPYPFMNMGLSENGPRIRDGFIDLMNMPLCQKEPRVRDGFIDMMNMPLSETGPRIRDGFYDLMNAPSLMKSPPFQDQKGMRKDLGRIL